MSGIIKRIGNIVRANMAPTTPNYLDSQRDLFDAKYATLTQRKQKQEATVKACRNKKTAWDTIISEREREFSRYGQGYLSKNAKNAMLQLLEQAKATREIAEQEHAMQLDTLHRILDQLTQVEAVLFRLKSAHYSISIQNSIREKALALNAPSSMDSVVDAFDLTELTRELRRVEYTTQALIELGAK
jgi:hypothetical protein